jgi:hypothetical protein
MRAKSLLWQACSIKIDEYSQKNQVITPVFYGGQGSMSHLGVQIESSFCKLFYQIIYK